MGAVTKFFMCAMHSTPLHKFLDTPLLPSSYFHPLNFCIHHSHSVTVPFARTTSFQCSFFVSACTLWNSLPSYVISLATACASLSHLPLSLSSLAWSCVYCIYCVYFYFCHCLTCSSCYTYILFLYKLNRILSHPFLFCRSTFRLAFGCYLVVPLQSLHKIFRQSSKKI